MLRTGLTNVVRDIVIPGFTTLPQVYPSRGMFPTMHHTRGSGNRPFFRPFSQPVFQRCRPKPNTRVTSRQLARHAIPVNSSRFLLASKIAVDGALTDLHD